jgi:hypothetical protein
MDGVVAAVSCSATYTFSKSNRASIRLLVGLGVEGDAHMGQTVKHRSRVAVDPNQPNLRQVHLIQAALHDELRAAAFTLAAGRSSSQSQPTALRRAQQERILTPLPPYSLRSP